MRPEGRAQAGADAPGGFPAAGGRADGEPDGWGVYEPYPADEMPEYPWLADQTLQLRTIPEAALTAGPPAPGGGRAERRRAAQG
ncbi:hypothetical protein ACFVH7_40340, partial [Kitasatospora indigofera]